MILLEIVVELGYAAILEWFEEIGVQVRRSVAFLLEMEENIPLVPQQLEKTDRASEQAVIKNIELSHQKIHEISNLSH